MGFAMRMYVDDTKFYPLYDYTTNAPLPLYVLITPVFWQQELQPYFQLSWTNLSYHCPAYNGNIGWHIGELAAAGSYSFNLFGASSGTPGLGLGVGFDQGSPWPPNSEAHVIAPGEMFALMDCQEVDPSHPLTPFNSGLAYIGTGWSGSDWTSCFVPGGAEAIMSYPLHYPVQHGKVLNVLSCDGHAAAVRVSDLFNPTNTARNWNVDNQPHPEFWYR